MYKEYFNLSEMPFSIAPDPRFLFMSDRHREALAHLLYGVQGEGGIVLLTGEIGTGKTTLCRSLLEQLPANIDVAFILNPLMRARELLQTMCEEYHIDIGTQRPGIKVFVDAIHRRLLENHAQGRRALLIIDEAQNLSPLVLEQLRLLTNLETNSRKLMQIILIGQPELQNLLAQPVLRQVAQRVIARYHLTQLGAHEVQAYVAHRLRVAGAAQALFPTALIKKLHRASGGVPRVINLVCDRALLGTYAQGQQEVSAATLAQAVSEVLAADRPPRRAGWAIAAAVIVAGGVAAALIIIQPAPLRGWVGALRGAPQASAALAAAPAPAAFATMPEPVATLPTVEVEETATPVPIASSSEPPAPAALAALSWPRQLASADSETMAFAALFKAYAISGEGIAKGGACRRAEEQGLRCYSGRGGLSDLFLLDQIAVLRLTAPDGREIAATLTSLDRQSATLIVGGGEQRIALADLADAWSGNFVVLWRAPAAFRSHSSLAGRGPAVDWLRRALAQIDGLGDDGAGGFDAALARRVRAFQLAEGIRPDGYVGPLTVVRINVRSGEGGPGLVAGKKG